MANDAAGVRRRGGDSAAPCLDVAHGRMCELWAKRRAVCDRTANPQQAGGSQGSLSDLRNRNVSSARSGEHYRKRQAGFDEKPATRALLGAASRLWRNIGL